MFVFFRKIFNRLTASRNLALTVIVLACILVYANSFGNDFVMDDFDFILGWDLIQDMNNLPQFFGPASQPEGHEGVYSPLKTLFHAVSFRFWGTNPVGYHIVALLIHILATILVYHISFRLTRHSAMALVAGVLFAVHPVHVESVTFMTASIDTLGVLFLLTSFWLYLRARENPPRLRRGFYAFSLVCAVLAVFTYELTLALPFLFALYEFCFNRGVVEARRSFVRLLPYFVLVGTYALIKWSVLGAIVRAENFSEGYLQGSFYLTMLVMIKAFAKYVWICLWPVFLHHNHPISGGIFSFAPEDFNQAAVALQSLWDVQVLLSLVFLAALGWVAVRFRKQQPLITFGIGWFFFSLLPVSNIIPTSIFFGERYLYPGTLGFCLLAAYFLIRLYEKGGDRRKGAYRFLAVVLGSALILFYAGRTVLRNRDWQDDLTFTRIEAVRNPKSATLWTNLGIVNTYYGLYDQAEASFNKALSLNPHDPHIYFSLAETYSVQRKYLDAIRALKEALKVDPNFAEAHYNLAAAYGNLGQMDKAEEALQQSIQLLKRQGREEEARQWEAAFYDYLDRFGPAQP